jgi:hypothetical protein
MKPQSPPVSSVGVAVRVDPVAVPVRRLTGGRHSGDTRTVEADHVKRVVGIVGEAEALLRGPHDGASAGKLLNNLSMRDVDGVA